MRTFQPFNSVFLFLENFTEEKFEQEMFSEKVAVCGSCFDKLEEYDRICLQAARIQEEIAQCFSSSQEKYRVDSSDILQCETCSKKFTTVDDLNEHFCLEDGIIVEYVDDTSDQVSDGESSQSTSRQERKLSSCNYTCNTCNEQFGKKRDYKLHVKLAHLPDGADVFTCSQCCDNIFVSEIELKLHTTVAHPADPTATSFECPVPTCAKAFSTRSLLNRHFGIHSANSERPHVCDICGKTFFHYRYLLNITISLTQKYIYPNVLSSFQAHIKIHTDTRDYNCSQCAKTFRSQSHLNRHLKTHTKQKDHECSGEFICTAKCFI